MSNILHNPGYSSTPAAALAPNWLGLLGQRMQRIRADLKNKGWMGLAHTAWRMAHIAVEHDQHMQWLAIINQDATRKIIQKYPRLAYRYSLPCLSSVFSWAHRLSILKTHYQFINSRLGKAFFDHVLDDTQVLWSRSIDGHSFAISLTGPCLKTIHREGEFTLNLRMEHQTLCKVAFSIVPGHTVLSPHESLLHGDEEHLLYVGQVQGAPAAFDEIKLATKLCHDVAPQDLLMSALSGFAQSLGMGLVAGVSTEHNISYDKLTQHGRGFDYNGFWERYGAVKSPEGHHVMTLPFPEKPLHLIQSRHRSRNKTKRAFKAEVQAGVACSMGRWV